MIGSTAHPDTDQLYLTDQRKVFDLAEKFVDRKLLQYDIRFVCLFTFSDESLNVVLSVCLLWAIVSLKETPMT